MKVIRLTQGKTTKVDNEDFYFLNQWKWQAQFSYGRWYARRMTGGTKKQRRAIHMHREITGCKKGLVVDHRNHDTLDNRKVNLRICTVAENAMNKKCRKDSGTGIKGVNRPKGKKYFIAEVRAGGKRLYFGYFRELKEAEVAYKKMAKKFFGEYAYEL
jgi:hypothetical protein